MAAAAAKSSSGGSGDGGSADSYIGNFISLTSKSEIRYEGVLYNINTQESTIGLRNVRSFGTEGRKRDGPQVPPSNKIYEFILFRGSDIKDLQVKSAPPVQIATPIHSDPAIIQSHYPQAPHASVSLPSGTGSLPDPSSHDSPHGFSGQTFQGSFPLYQPAGNLGPGSSSSHPPTTTGNGLSMPMYWQGYYGPSNGLQPQQQAFVQPPPGLSMPPSKQYPAINASKFSASQLSENLPPLLPSFTTGAQNLQSSLHPAQSFPTVSDSANLIPDTASIQALPTANPSSNLPLASPLTTTLVKSSTISLVIDEPKIVKDPVMPFKSISEPLSTTVRMSSSVLNEGTTPSLVTPGHFLQSGPSMVPSLRSSQTVQKDVETHGGSGYTHHGSRGGHGRGRGNQFFHSSTRFTEEFDFTAMNEKFNKDEVWGHLGKNNISQGDWDDSQNEDNTRLSKSDVKPVYVKDNFFDSLSCDALDGGSRDGRTRFSDKFKRDAETFGNFVQHRGGGGGWGRSGGGLGRSQGGRSQSGYHGRGYGYVGRGQGYSMSNHVV